MARGKKKDPAPATTAPEATTTPEAHLGPGQFEGMDDATLQGLAKDLGLDPAAYEGRDALIAAIAAVPVIPGPPEAEADPVPAQETPAGTTPPPEAVPIQEDPAPAQETAPEITLDPVPAQEDTPVQNPDPVPAQETPPVPPGERPLPYKAAVAVSLAVVHKEVGLGTADMLKAVGSLRQGTPVTVTGRKGIYAQLKNGLYISEAFLEVQPIS